MSGDCDFCGSYDHIERGCPNLIYEILEDKDTILYNREKRFYKSEITDKYIVRGKKNKIIYEGIDIQEALWCLYE